MPVDLKGRKIQPGDSVILRGTVLKVFEPEQPGAYNVHVNLVDTGNTGEAAIGLTITSRLLEVQTPNGAPATPSAAPAAAAKS